MSTFTTTDGTTGAGAVLGDGIIGAGEATMVGAGTIGPGMTGVGEATTVGAGTAHGDGTDGITGAGPATMVGAVTTVTLTDMVMDTMVVTTVGTMPTLTIGADADFTVEIILA